MKNWTDSQKAAIEIDGRTVLVSAGAGSGKTAVLTERILEKIKNGSRDISELAVVTFTKAAAAELRERIYSNLSAAIAAEPRNKRLSKQFLEIGSAQISTVDSFCYDLVKQNASKCGLSKGVRIADTAEMALLKSKVMNDLIDECYDSGGSAADIENFSDFIENFVKLTDENTADTFIKLADRLSNYADSTAILSEESKNLYEFAENGGDIFSSAFGQVLRNNLYREFLSYKQIFEKAVKRIGETDVWKGCEASFAHLLDFTVECVRLIEKGDGNTLSRLICGFVKPGAGSVSAEDKTPELEYYYSLRTDFYKFVAEHAQKNFLPLAEAGKKLFLMTADICGKLSALLNEYQKRLTEEKKKRSIIEFSDVERTAFELLSDSSVAAGTASGFREMYIDEYQDINKLQDGIFRKIAEVGVSRFMVGDIKQCIYAFRGAVPELFADYRKSFEKYSANKSEYKDVSVFLSNNFRCDSTVIDFVNAVFGSLFPYGSGRVPYIKEDALVYSKKQSDNHIAKKPQILILDKKNAPADSGFTEEAYVAKKDKRAY